MQASIRASIPPYRVRRPETSAYNKSNSQMGLDYTVLFLYRQLDITEEYQAHNDAGCYPLSSVILICGSLSTRVFFCNLGPSLKACVQLGNYKISIRYCAYYKKAQQISMIVNNDKSLFYSE